MIDVLAGLQRHPEVRKLGMTVDTGNAWQVCFALLQLLPVDSAVKYQLLGLSEINALVEAVDEILTELSG